MLKIRNTFCSSSVCGIDEEINEENFFEKFFWFFIIPSAILIGISIFLEYIYELVLLSQIFAIFSISLSSFGVVKEAIEDIREKKITANVLMIIAAIASFFILHGQEGAMAILLYAIAERLEKLTTEKSRNAIKELLELVPDEALIKGDQGYHLVPSKEINKGDIVGIKSGMKAPLDGIVIKGESYFDESAITGESIPVFKDKGTEVFAASINKGSFVDIEVNRESHNTIVAQIAENIKIAQLNKSEQEKFIEKFAKYYTPIILITALLIMIIPPLFFGLDFNDWFYRGLILLVVSCPCALTLSTPLANVTALTKLAKEGILVKGNKFIEQVNNIEVIAFDKTGTLTEGNLKVFDIYAFKGNKEEILRTAASLEILSEHPIGKAIVDQANKVNLSLYTIDKFEVLKGKGIMGKINGELFKVGNRRFFEDMNYKIPYEILENIKISGTIPIMLGNNSELLGIITIRDVLRISAPVLVKGLFKRGYDSFLISGDNQAVCDTIGACLDITESYGELLPDQKIEKIKALKKEYKGVAMVGDGINDAPALALSDLGIAIGASATDLTLETADVIIMNDDLTKLLTFIDIAKKTNKIIKQNIWSSIIIKITFAILTVIGLMTLWLAVGISDMGLSLAIMLNSMTIFRYKIKYSKVPSEKLESKARMIVCKTCQTKNILPQHHGRDMVQEGKKLVCWRKMLNNGFLEPCEEELPLNCPTCQNLLELK